jgi:hypothetical protein
MTTRTTIHYGGEEYVVPRSAEDLKSQIDEIIAGGSGWLAVNHGRGQLQVAHILISSATPVGLIDTSDPSGSSPEELD